MPDQSKQTEVALFTSSARGINEEQLADLKAKFGIDLKIRSSSDVVDKAIRQADQKKDYDRTNPGYDRYYDKNFESKVAQGTDIAINPDALTERD